MTASMPDDYYEALGVPRDATASAIKLAYRKLVLKHHPDKVDDQDKASAADRFHQIQTAWETIGDEDKRSRYDAQVRLASLRREKELAERHRFASPAHSPSLSRMSSDYRPPAASPRAPPSRSYSYRAVEVQPSFDTDNFDKTRTSERKDFDFEHDRRRRTPPKDDRHRSKISREDSKESERARHREKGRQTTKATARDREMKYSYARPEVMTDSDSDYFERRSPRDLPEEQRARDRFMEQARQQEEEARSNRYMHERAQKLFSDAQDYQQRMRSSRGQSDVRRPSPTRASSAREHVEFGRAADGRPATVRRGSLKPRTSSRDDADLPRSSRRGSERDILKSGDSYDDAPRRPPSLSQTKSAPNEIRIPVEKQRSNSVQFQASVGDDFIPPPVRRADSMPHAASKERSKPIRASALRQNQTMDDYDSRRSPTRSYPSRSPKDYSDDHDSPTRDSYRTEVREPVGRRLTRSPSPMRAGDKSRSASNRYPVQPPLPRTTSKTYAYPVQSGADILTSRPKLSRGDSGHTEPYLFGEVPTTRSPRERDSYSSVPPKDNIRIRNMRPDVKVATGYTSNGRRPSEGRSPSYYRANSYNSPPVSA